MAYSLPTCPWLIAVTGNDTTAPPMRPAVRQNIMIVPARGASEDGTIAGPICMQVEETYPLLRAKNIMKMNTTNKKSACRDRHSRTASGRVVMWFGLLDGGWRDLLQNA